MPEFVTILSQNEENGVQYIHPLTFVMALTFHFVFAIEITIGRSLLKIEFVAFTIRLKGHQKNSVLFFRYRENCLQGILIT